MRAAYYQHVSAPGAATSSLDGPIEGLLDLAALSSAPYPIYRRLRDEAPVVWSDRLGAWLVSRYADVQGVLADTERLLQRGARQAADTPAGVWDAFAGFRGFFWSDPPQYTAYRQTWTRAFKPRLKGLAAVVQATVDELLDEV